MISFQRYLLVITNIVTANFTDTNTMSRVEYMEPMIQTAPLTFQIYMSTGTPRGWLGCHILHNILYGRSVKAGLSCRGQSSKWPISLKHLTNFNIQGHVKGFFLILKTFAVGKFSQYPGCRFIVHVNQLNLQRLIR